MIDFIAGTDLRDEKSEHHEDSRESCADADRREQGILDFHARHKREDQHENGKDDVCLEAEESGEGRREARS